MKPHNLSALILAFAASLLLAGCSSSSSSSPIIGSPVPGLTYTASVSSSTLTFTASPIGLATTQTVTLTNTGTGALTLSIPTLSGSSAFVEITSCTGTLAVNATCTASVVFTPPASATPYSGTLTFASNATNSPATVGVTGTGSGVAAASATADCSVTGGTCGAALPLSAVDPISTGGFHGYADPSFRKDPNGTASYLAYSWAHTMPDGTHAVDIHLSQSVNGGTSFTYVGPMYQSAQTTQTTSNAYASVNYTDTEVIDLLPIALTGTSAGQTLWVQAHQSYLGAALMPNEGQLNPTAVISVTAVQLATPAAAGAGTSLLALGSASTGEARLGANDTDPTRNVTQNIAALSPNTSKCGNFSQPALWYQGGTLYLALECAEITGTGAVDANELAHFLYSTTPTGSDASKWSWAYVGEFGTAAQVAKLGALPSENVAYAFFTEPEFALTKSGQLVIIMTPSVFSPAGSTQPVIQYGCRVIPITISPTSVALDIDSTTSSPVVLAKTTEADLYTSPNEGPAACTYEPTSNLGIIMGRKYENDPSLGFYIYPVNTGIAP